MKYLRLLVRYIIIIVPSMYFIYCIYFTLDEGLFLDESTKNSTSINYIVGSFILAIALIILFFKLLIFAWPKEYENFKRIISEELR